MPEDDTATSTAPTEPLPQPDGTGAPPPRGKARDRRSSWWFVSGVALVSLALAAASTVLAEPERREPERPAAPSPPPPRALTEREIEHRDAVVRSTLKKRARAVLGHDREAFLADVDRRDDGFVRDQERLFENLSQLKFAAWRYDLTKDGYERPELVAKYHTTAVYLPPLVLHYAIKGYDEAEDATAVPIVMTFVKRGADWQIASDSDVDSDLPEAGHAEPWDRREMVVGEGEHVLILGDAEDRGDVDDLVELGDRSVRRVAAMWPTGWDKKVVISAVRDQRLIETYFRTELQSSDDVAAIAVPTFTEVTNWVNDRPRNREQELAGFRVIINPRYFDPDDEFNGDLLTHEIAHVATGPRTLAGAPTWLVEGAAEYTAYRHGPPMVKQIDADELPSEFTRQLDDGEVYLPDYDFFRGDIGLNYLIGHLACEYLAERYGEATLRKLYLRLGRVGREIDTLEQQDKGFRALLGRGTRQFQRDLASYISRSV